MAAAAGDQDARLSSVYRRMTAMESRIGGIELKLDKILTLLSGGTVAGPKFTPACRAVPGGLFNNAASKAQQMMRPPKAEDLLTRGARLRRVTTREATGEVQPQEIACMAKIYADSQGDLQKLSRESGANPALLEKNPPRDATEFAKNLLSGAYTKAAEEEPPSTIGPPTASALLAGHGALKRVEEEPEPKDVMPSDSEIAVMARIYERCGGDLDMIAADIGASAMLLRKHAPADATEFGRNLLLGLYTDFGDADVSQTRLAKAVANGRMNFSEDELAARCRGLQKVEERPRDDIVAPTSTDVEVVAKIYRQNGGDWDKIASVCDIEAWILKKNPPDDEFDFASRLLGGVYADEQ